MDINTSTLDVITGVIAIAILLGGMLMMFTTIFSTKFQSGDIKITKREKGKGEQGTGKSP
ncbi:hypothetical protein Cal6303_5542 [Calothrix sp. PCC 6303]|nr:hypothetical protein Cal6303_5542 [Calothrix sp. PCC 6303]